MKIHSYVVEHDLGFAPNPFHGFCTLACCKPDIRKHARIGDLVVGTGGARVGNQGHIVYWMQVSERVAIDEYWEDLRFRKKRPYMRGSAIQRYGDNIYFRSRPNSNLEQLDSFHSHSDGSVNLDNLKRDTGRTQSVLIAKNFSYWGGSGPKLPINLAEFVKKGPGHKSNFTQDNIKAFLAWISQYEERGFLKEPGDWKYILV